MKNVIYPLAMAWGVYSLGVEAKEKQPNIVFIMADDLGWTDLSIMGSDYYETPHIDRLAKAYFLRMHTPLLLTLHLAGLV